MSLERRLRDELQHEADAIQPDVARHLGTVEAGARRRGGVGVPTLLIGAAIVAAAIILRLPDGLANLGAGAGPAASNSASPIASPIASPPAGSAAYGQIAGIYHATLDPTSPNVKEDGLGGSWTVQLEASGAVLLSPPVTFTEGANGLSGVAFSLTADRFRTDLFYNDHCSSVGTYQWSLAAGRLTFTELDDTCSIRRTLLTTTPWLTNP